MKTYCVKCRKMLKILTQKWLEQKNNRFIMQAKCSVCGIKKLGILKEKEAKGLLSNLGIKILLSKILLVYVLL